MQEDVSCTSLVLLFLVLARLKIRSAVLSSAYSLIQLSQQFDYCISFKLEVAF